MSKPNVLFIMTDQQRADTIAALGNSNIYTPNLDRLVRRGVSFVNGYSTCPVCVPARYTVRTGCEPLNTAVYENQVPQPVKGQADTMEARCGPYLARTMRSLGYRTFGIGKFHTVPWDEDIGYETQLYSEELFGDATIRSKDSYAAFIAEEHPEFDYIEGLHGERTEMYYMPQISPLPAALTVEAWVADRAVEQILSSESRPYFGFVSFIGPHPPFAPPIPYNRMYDPDRLPNPIRGDKTIDHMDEQITWMNHAIWAEDINDPHARVLKARYYGEISYVDSCIGRVLDAVESREDAGNTLICFFADHGDHLGDHAAWQKESFFEAACHVPFLVSWPVKLPEDIKRTELVCLTDLFGIATTAAGRSEIRDGVDVIGMLRGRTKPREYLLGYYGLPGTPRFKIMVRDDEWKYIFMANGGFEQLFNLKEDPNELRQLTEERPDVVKHLRDVAIEALQTLTGEKALCGDSLRRFPLEKRSNIRIKQFDRSRGVVDFSERPEDALRAFERQN